MGRYRRILDEDGETALRCYGMTLINSLDPAERTLALQKFGVEVEAAVDLYNLGVHATRSENWAQAIEYFRRAIETDPEMVDAIYNMAVCYEKTGFVPQAKDTWNVYAQAVGDEAEAERVRRHMAELD